MPDKFGYWLGYRIIKMLSENFSIQDMLNWMPDHANEMMMTELKKIMEQEAGS